MFGDRINTLPIIFEIGDLQNHPTNLYYRIPISSKVNIITGDSGIGKSVLVELVDEYNNDVYSNIECSLNLPILANINILELKSLVETQQRCLVILDEDNEIINNLLNTTSTKLNPNIIHYESFYNCAKLISESNCIFILIVRQEIVNLPVPQHSYLKMKTTSNINEHIFKPVCEEQWCDISLSYTHNDIITIIEDSVSGVDFLVNTIGIKNVISSYGISNMVATLQKVSKDYKTINVIFDYIGAGPFIQDILSTITELRNNGLQVFIMNWFSLEYYYLRVLNMYTINNIYNDVSIYNKEKYLEKELKSLIYYKKNMFLSKKLNCVNILNPLTCEKQCDFSRQDCVLRGSNRRQVLSSMLLNELNYNNVTNTSYTFGE